MRLLYVALTRAADRLIVSGVMPKAKKDGSDPRPASSWHVIVERALELDSALPVKTMWVALVCSGEQAAEATRVSLPPVVYARMGAARRPARSAAAAAAGTVGHRGRRRSAAAAERRHARGGDPRDADPPVARATGSGGRRSSSGSRAPVARTLRGPRRCRPPATRSSCRSAASCPTPASPPLFGPARWAKRRSRRPCPTGG